MPKIKSFSLAHNFSNYIKSAQCQCAIINHFDFNIFGILVSNYSFSSLVLSKSQIIWESHFFQIPITSSHWHQRDVCFTSSTAPNVNKAVWRTAISPAAEWQGTGLKIQGSNWWPSIVTLTLSLHCWDMSSAHQLTKANIWPKFNKYLSKGSGDMEWTWYSRLKLVTFNCDLDLDLESACLSYGFCKSPHKGKHLTKVSWKSFKGFEIWSEQERDRWPSIVTLTLSLHRWVIGSTHHLTTANIWPKFNKAVWMAMERP